MEVIAAVDWGTGVGAAAAGAVITALSTAWVSNRLDQQKELRETYGAVRVVRQELGENRDKIEKAEERNAIEGLRDKRTDGKNDLTLGDWLASKTQFAGLTRSDEKLWRGVAKAYAEISDFNRGAAERPPLTNELDELISRLEAAERDLANKLGWPHPRRLKGWVARD